jgi:putative membrane protein insertion efficiency factor
VTRLRSAVRAASSPVRWLLIAVIRGYRLTLSGWLGGRCKYYPSCSAYAEEAVGRHGVLRGSILAAWRLLRCNPYSKGGVDQVPGHVPYDGMAQRAAG